MARTLLLMVLTAAVVAMLAGGFLDYSMKGSEQGAGSTTDTSTSCTVSAEASGFFVTVETDSGLPVAGAQVSGTRVTEYGGGSTCEQSIGSQLTNASGMVLITDNMGSYNALTVQFQGKNYAMNAPIVPMETTYVTLRVPSGNYSISEVFEGGCTKTPSGVTCPG